VVGAVGQDVWWALVAADDSEFWLSLRRELPGLEARLFTVRTGRDCLRAIEDRRTRLVVLDSSLGDVSGPHLVHLVRQIRPDLGIILTFSASDQEQEKEARQAGILYYGDREGVRDIAQVIRKCMSARERAPGARDATAGDPRATTRNATAGDARTGTRDATAGDAPTAARDAAGDARTGTRSGDR
jgi:DNA-binding NtrC family response regulator